MDDILILKKNEKVKNKYGVWELVSTPREVFCAVQSVTQTEFFEGGRNGLNPAYQFKVFRGDYDNEVECEYKGQGYAIYRTYMESSDYIELYAERQGGTNGQ